MSLIKLLPFEEDTIFICSLYLATVLLAILTPFFPKPEQGLDLTVGFFHLRYLSSP